MILPIVQELVEKYRIPKDRRYQIKYLDSTISPPLSLEEIAASLMDQKLTGQEEVSLYPQENFKTLSSEPIFYDLLFYVLQNTNLTPAQIEDITKVLKESTQVLPKKEKAVAPSKIMPPSSFQHEDEDQTLSEETPPDSPSNKKRFFITFFLCSLLLVLVAIVLLPQKSQKTTLPSYTLDYVTVILPHQTVATADPSKAKELYEKALAIYTKDTVQGYKDTLKLLYEGLSAFPTDIQSLTLMAKSYLYLWELSRQDKTYTDAIQTLIDRALKIDASSLEAQEAKALLFLRKEKVDTALGLIESNVKLENVSGESFLIQGEILYLKGSHDAAISSFEKALELNPELARCHYFLGKSYQKKNDPEKAYEFFWIGLNLHPEHALSRLEASLIDIQTFNNLTKAQDNLKIIIQFPSLLPFWDLAKAHYHLGWIYEEQKQLDFALKEYKKATELDPKQEAYLLAFKKLGGDEAITPSAPVDATINEESLYFVTIGNRYLEEDRLIDALAQYKAALQIDPKNYLAYFQLGQVSEKQKKWKEAIDFYKKAIQIKGNHIDSYLGISKIELRYFNYSTALQYIEKVKSFQPRSPLIYNLSGFYYTQKGDIEKAMNEYKKATDLDPDNFEAHFELGVLNRDQKDYVKAQKYFLRSLKIKPDESKIQTEVAQLYFEQGLKSQAVEHLKKLISAYPLNDGYVTGLGKLYYLGQDYNFSKEMYLKALSIRSDSIDALEGLALTYISLEHYKEALDTYKKIIKIDPSDAKWYFERGKIQFNTGNFDPALLEFKLTSQINDNYPLVHFYTARTAFVMSDVELSEEELKKEIKINPHLKDPYMALGNILAQQNRLEEAQEQFRMYIRLDPSNPDAYMNLGLIHQRLGRFDTAIEFFKMALEKAPDRGQAYLQLGYIYKHLDQKSNAIEAFENFIRISPDAPNIPEVQKLIKDLKKF